MKTPAQYLLAVLLGAAGAAPAAAQAVPSDPQIDQRIRDVGRAPGDPAALQEEAILTGRDDILLMRQRQFFTLYGSAGVIHSTNAALTPDERHKDQFLAADLGLRISTKLGNLVDVYAEAGLSTTRYFGQLDLDYTAAFGGVGAHVPVAGFDVDVSYTPVVVWDRDAKDRQLTQHRIAGSVGKAMRVGRGIVRASIGGERIEADPTPFKNSAATASIAAIFPLSGRLSLLTNVRGARRWYDNYFEGLLGVKRRDWFLEGAAGLSMQFDRHVGVDVRAAYTKNWSSADVSRYKAGTLGLVFRASVRF